MKEIYSKVSFPSSPGGHIYHWESVDIAFDVKQDGKYVIKIIASAKNAAQNQSHDDDDLRVAIDGYEFGKYEIHDEKVSWKGFGTAASWDGASLRGGTKTVFFFVELKSGQHTLEFYADETPQLSDIKVFQLGLDDKFGMEEHSPSQNIEIDEEGIPWMSFIFLGIKPCNFEIESVVKSASQKGGSDGDNLKVVINGKTLKNQNAPDSRKYKNFYFSGDINVGKSEILKIEPKDFEFLEDSVELWYDEQPSARVQITLFNNVKEWMKKDLSEKTKIKFYESILRRVARIFSLLGYEYASRFLIHSLSDHPQKLCFENNSPLVNKIKKDESYQKILTIIKDQIRNGVPDGQVSLGNEEQGSKIDFEKGDLKYSIHGLRKIEYSTSRREGDKNMYDLEFTLFDVYDFNPKEYEFGSSWFLLNVVNTLESDLVLKNFEIEINLLDSIKL